MFVVIMHYKKPLTVIDQHLAAHRNFLEEGYSKNYLVVSGPKNPRTGGIIISNLTDKKTLEDFLHRDPFYLNQIAEYEMIEFSPVKYHKDFEKFVVT